MANSVSSDRLIDPDILKFHELDAEGRRAVQERYGAVGFLDPEAARAHVQKRRAEMSAARAAGCASGVGNHAIEKDASFRRGAEGQGFNLGLGYLRDLFSKIFDK